MRPQLPSPPQHLTRRQPIASAQLNRLPDSVYPHNSSMPDRARTKSYNSTRQLPIE